MNGKISINFVVEDSGWLKYLGCSTAAQYLYKGLEKVCSPLWNSNKRCFDIIHFHTFGPKAIFYKKIAKGTKIITAHSTPRLNQSNFQGGLKFESFYKKMYNSYDHIIAVSNICKKELIDLGVKTEISVIPNCIDLNKFKYSSDKRKIFRKKYGISKDEKVILNVAQQTPRKGIDDFIKIAETYNKPNIKFIWVGSMPYSIFSKDYFRINKLKKNCKGNIQFLGFVDDITEAYCGADLFLSPSYAEGMPIVFLEALSTGLGVLTRDIPEFKEVFRNNISYFEEMDDIEKLIQKLLPNQKNTRKINDFIKKYDAGKVADRHLKLYNSIIN
ncbi:MAG: glycosyltransferase family 4 protein [Candidatus Aenigmarchaeota archaeon]|nr:glycosyltransferase family 4 protein [Candidatus Aenigmarchaeota archaeon]